MPRERSMNPCPVQGAGDALLHTGVPPHLERFLNTLLLLAVLHFLLQMAVYFSCIFLVLPMGFMVSNIICGANSIMSAASRENVLTEHRLGRGSGEGAWKEEEEQQQQLFPLPAVEEMVLSLATAYFLLRTGLIFCNLIFILPLVFLLPQ